MQMNALFWGTYIYRFAVLTMHIFTDPFAKHTLPFHERVYVYDVPVLLQ